MAFDKVRLFSMFWWSLTPFFLGEDMVWPTVKEALCQGNVGFRAWVRVRIHFQGSGVMVEP